MQTATRPQMRLPRALRPTSSRPQLQSRPLRLRQKRRRHRPLPRGLGNPLASQPAKEQYPGATPADCYSPNARAGANCGTPSASRHCATTKPLPTRRGESIKARDRRRPDLPFAARRPAHPHSNASQFAPGFSGPGSFTSTNSNPTARRTAARPLICQLAVELGASGAATIE